jgi:hypothetical protein
MKSEINTQKIHVPENIPCFLCGDFQKIKLSKKNKPYFICNICGIQAFIRKDDGVNRLNDLINNPVLYKKIYLTGSFLENSILLKLKERIKLIKEELSKFAFYLINSKDIEMEKTLKSKLKRLELEYNKYLNVIDDIN